MYQAHEAMCFVLALVFTITSELGKQYPYFTNGKTDSERLGDRQGCNL